MNSSVVNAVMSNLMLNRLPNVSKFALMLYYAVKIFIGFTVNTISISTSIYDWPRKNDPDPNKECSSPWGADTRRPWQPAQLHRRRLSPLARWGLF
jgi:hypothetical protein